LPDFGPWGARGRVLLRNTGRQQLKQVAAFFKLGVLNLKIGVRRGAGAVTSNDAAAFERKPVFSLTIVLPGIESRLTSTQRTNMGHSRDGTTLFRRKQRLSTLLMAKRNGGNLKLVISKNLVQSKARVVRLCRIFPLS